MSAGEEEEEDTMQLDINSDTGSFTTKTLAFTSWLAHQADTYLHPGIGVVDLRQSGAGRGVFTKASIPEGETLFSIPRNVVLCVEKSQLNEEIPEVLSALDSWLALILVMIYETRDSSPWKPYFDILPREFDTLMYWDPAELSELKGSAVLEKIGKEDAESQFKEKLLPIVQAHQHLFQGTELEGSDNHNGINTIEDRLLAISHRMATIIMSYSFDVELPKTEEDDNNHPSSGSDDDDDEEEEKGKYIKGMVPMADLLNADGIKNNCRLFYTPTHLEMRSLRPLTANEELFNDYGPLPRSDLLRRYGYITPNYADHDVVEISSNLILESIPHSLNQREKLGRIDFLLEEEVLDDAFDLTTDHEIPLEILSIIHTLLIHDDTIFRDCYKAREKVPKPKRDRVSKAVVIDILEKRLGMYPTDIAADEEELSRLSAVTDEAVVVGNSSTRRRKMAIEVRLGEKRILQGCLEGVRAWDVAEGNDKSGKGKRNNSDQRNGVSSSKKVKV